MSPFILILLLAVAPLEVRLGGEPATAEPATVLEADDLRCERRTYRYALGAATWQRLEAPGVTLWTLHVDQPALVVIAAPDPPSHLRGGRWDRGSLRGLLLGHRPLVAAWATAATLAEQLPVGVTLTGPERKLALQLGEPLAADPLLLDDGHRLEGRAACVSAAGVQVLDGAVTDAGGAVLASRRTWPLDVSDGWRLAADPAQRGLALGWHSPAWRDGDWLPVSVGTPWEQHGLARYDGVGWYRRRLALPPELRAGGGELRFGGIDDDTEAWVDGAGPISVRGWQTPVRLPLPAGRRWVQVALRVLDTGGGGGVYTRAELHPPAP